MLTDVCLKLSELYQHINWISERNLKYERFNSDLFGDDPKPCEPTFFQCESQADMGNENF